MLNAFHYKIVDLYTPGVDFTNILLSFSLVTFRLCNFWRKNGVRKMLMKSTPGVNFINNLQAAFRHADP